MAKGVLEFVSSTKGFSMRIPVITISSGALPLSCSSWPKENCDIAAQTTRLISFGLNSFSVNFIKYLSFWLALADTLEIINGRPRTLASISSNPGAQESWGNFLGEIVH